MGMYVRTITRKNKNGSIVEYVQLAHNSRHPEKGYSRADVLYSFGRRDQLDVDAIKRLINSLSRFLSPEDVMELEAHANDLTFVSSRPAGGAYILKAFWEKLHIDKFIETALEDRAISFPVEHALFAMAANRALAPC